MGGSMDSDIYIFFIIYQPSEAQRGIDLDPESFLARNKAAVSTGMVFRGKKGYEPIRGSMVSPPAKPEALIDGSHHGSAHQSEEKEAMNCHSLPADL
eukprot:1394493-Amorphochlora_amoeboformis.AAC.2